MTRCVLALACLEGSQMAHIYTHGWPATGSGRYDKAGAPSSSGLPRIRLLGGASPSSWASRGRSLRAGSGETLGGDLVRASRPVDDNGDEGIPRGQRSLIYRQHPLPRSYRDSVYQTGAIFCTLPFPCRIHTGEGAEGVLLGEHCVPASHDGAIRDHGRFLWRTLSYPLNIR